MEKLEAELIDEREKYTKCRRCKGTWSPYNHSTGCCDSCESEMYRIASRED
jgi:Zn finger protein HypA/HybF involved in hydrogenase expression